MVVDYNNNSYKVEIIKKNNKNLYIRVKEGKIVVTCNYFNTNRQIEKLIKDNYNSIVKMINKYEFKQEKKEQFYMFGKQYDVVYGFKELEITEDKIFVLNKKELEKHLDKNIKEIYANRLDYWYKLFEEKIPTPNLKIRKMTSRWGVCNLKNNNITLNYYLHKYNLECLDYVIIHELSHFIHPNHSSSFWKLVEKYCNNYKIIRKKLKN